MHKHTYSIRTYICNGCMHVYCSIFIRLLTDELLGCFQFLASVTTAERESTGVWMMAFSLSWVCSTGQISRPFGLSCCSLGYHAVLCWACFFSQSCLDFSLGLITAAPTGIRMLCGSGLQTLVISDAEPVFM